LCCRKKNHSENEFLRVYPSSFVVVVAEKLYGSPMEHIHTLAKLKQRIYK
jgi:hypothetical protein